MSDENLRSKIPAELISSGPANSFGPGSLIFTPFAWYGIEHLQIGVRVGNDDDIFALSPWHGGRSKAGSVVTTRDDHPVFGVHATEDRKAKVFVDPAASTSPAPDVFRGGLGLLGLGRTGLTLLSQKRDSQWAHSNVACLINPLSWEIVSLAPGMHPEAWLDNWSLEFEVGHRRSFEFSIQRDAS